jgi:hypothetical protein
VGDRDVDLTEKHSKADRSASNLGTPLGTIASNPEPSNDGGDTATSRSRPNSSRRRTIAKAPNIRKPSDDGSLGISVFQGVAELVRAKGYRIVPSPPKGIDLLATKPTELTGQGCIVDILPFKFHQELGLVKISDNSDGSEALRAENNGINALSDELIQSARSLITTVSEGDGCAGELGAHHPINTLVGDIETHSVNLLFGKLNYMRLNGKDVGFWVNPVLLTASQLENESGESKPWAPIPAKLRGLDFDVVGTTHLASYLDLREKEVKFLGRQVLKGEKEFGDIPETFRFFRLLTLGAALTLIGTLLVLTSNIAAGFPTALFGISLAATIEALGGWRVFRSYRRLQRDRKARIHTGSRMVTPEQVVMNEVQFTTEELPYLHSKYGGEELSKLKKEVRSQRIDELVRKAEDLLKKAEELENEELHSEAILSIESAIRPALNATLLSMGVEAQAREFDQWIASLRNILEEEDVVNLRYLRELRDKVSRGYDASHREVEAIMEKAKPIIENAVDRVKNSFKGSHSRSVLPTIEAPNNDLHTDFRKKTNRSRERLGDIKKAQEIDESEPRISSEILNTTQSLKFLLNVADDNELLNLGSAGDYLVKAKKTLETNATDQGERTEFPDTDSVRVSEELDGLVKSLAPQQARRKMVQAGKRGSPDSISDGVAAPRTILPFDNLADFRKAMTRCQLPLVVSFLSEDEPSKEVKTALESLVAKHHTRAAFIAVHSKSEDIARECKIKSYPTMLFFNGGKMLGELKLVSVEQLEKDLLELVESSSSDDQEEARQHGVQLASTESGRTATARQIGEQSDEIG